MLVDQASYNAYRKELALAFYESGINTPDKIELGLQRARRCATPWFPAIGQFVGWCMPGLSDYGLPTPEQAYIDASHHRWYAHPIVYQAAVEVGVYELKTQSARRMKSRYIAVYNRFVKRVESGEIFLDEVGKRRALVAKRAQIEQRPVTREEADAAKLKAREILGLDNEC